MSEGMVDTELVERLGAALYGLLVAGAVRWARVDLTMPQLKVLLLLGERGSARVSWLAEQMAVSPPNITGILDRLERRGWIGRQSDRVDRRVVRVVLTEAGRAVLTELCSASAERSAPCLQGLPAASRRQLKASLDELATALRAAGGGGEADGSALGTPQPAPTNGRRLQGAQRASARS
jgi:DNA-binding MarR family transcriptional regulator